MISKKLYLDLCSRVWLRPSRHLVNSFSSWGLWGLETWFGNGLRKSYKRFLNILILSEFRVIVSNQFHSLMVNFKKVFRKTLYLKFNNGIFLELLRVEWAIHWSQLRIHWRFIFGNIIRYSTIRLSTLFDLL